MATVQKRLHISGLTPTITENDIRTRLEKFIDVKTIDGFGKLNALGFTSFLGTLIELMIERFLTGEPRKFAYATVDGTEQNLARCVSMPYLCLFTIPIIITGLNQLSGTVWKGAKLRIGEAKPDYSQRFVSYVHSLHNKVTFTG